MDHDEMRRKAIAFHEAGHAVALMSFGYRIERCAIEAEVDKGRSTFQPTKKRDDREEVLIAIFGPFCESKIDIDADINSSDLDVVDNYFNDNGINRRNGIIAMHDIYCKSTSLYDKYWSVVEKIAEALLLHGVLTGDQVHAFWPTEIPDPARQANELG